MPNFPNNRNSGPQDAFENGDDFPLFHQSVIHKTDYSAQSSQDFLARHGRISLAATFVMVLLIVIVTWHSWSPADCDGDVSLSNTAQADLSGRVPVVTLAGVVQQAPAQTQDGPPVEMDKPSQPQKEFTLECIFSGPLGNLAVINGRTVQVGQKVDGATLLSVGRKSARLRTGERTFDVALRTEN